MTLRIGAGAGFAGDRIDPARDLVKRGALDYLALECLAERTLAYGHLQRLADPAKGYHLLIEKRLGTVLAACVANRTTNITKPQGTSGMLSVLTEEEQLMYKVHNLAAYLTPDVTADFSHARIAQMGTDRV